jgi:hypothetical protein
MLKTGLWHSESGQTITTRTSGDGCLYFSLEELCDLYNLPLEACCYYWQSHPLLKQGFTKQEVNGDSSSLIRADMTMLWLFELTRTKVIAAPPDELKYFQRQIAVYLDTVLYSHFFEEHSARFDWVPLHNPTIEAYQSLLAQLNMAREQMLFELLSLSQRKSQS